MNYYYFFFILNNEYLYYRTTQRQRSEVGTNIGGITVKAAVLLGGSYLCM